MPVVLGLDDGLEARSGLAQEVRLPGSAADAPGRPADAAGVVGEPGLVAEQLAEPRRLVATVRPCMDAGPAAAALHVALEGGPLLRGEQWRVAANAAHRAEEHDDVVPREPTVGERRRRPGRREVDAVGAAPE